MNDSSLEIYRKKSQQILISEQERTNSDIIYDVVFRLLVSEGYGNINLKQISKITGISRTTIYRRWASIDALIINAIANKINNSINIPTDQNSKENLKNLLLNLANFLQSPLGYAFLQSSLGIKDETSLRQRDTLWRERYNLIYQVFHQINSNIEQQMLNDIISMTLGSIYFHVFIKNQQVDERYIESITEITLNLLKVKN